MVPKETFQKEAPVPTWLEEAGTEKLAVRNILCPVDFSDFSLRAFRYAVSIARHFQASLFVEHTVQIPVSVFLEGADMKSVQSNLQASREEADRNLRHLVARSGVEISEVYLAVKEGDVCDQILQTIREHRIDLVVMGTHGHKGFSRLVLGSVAEHIIHEALCPVLVVSRPGAEFVAPDDQEPVHLKTILAATDFSPNSGRALTYALRWAAEWSSKLILFHSVAKPSPAMRGLVDLLPEYNPYFEKQIAEAWERLHAVLPPTTPPRCEVVYEVRQGEPKEQILQYAEERKPDLIVMGAQGAGRAAVAWGSTISAVVRDGRFPVLAIRHLEG